MSRQFLRLAVAPVLPVCALSAGLLTLTLGACSKDKVASSGPVTVVKGEAAIGGPFELVNQNGQTVTQETFKGRPQLIYFGFSNCPDVCPTALQQMAAALKMAGLGPKDIWPIFISVDPDNDTPEVLADYVTAPSFPPGLVGLTGTPEQVDHAKKTFKVYAARVPEPDGDSYSYDHSSLIYFMDGNGKFLDVFSSLDTPEKIAKRLKAYKKTGH